MQLSLSNDKLSNCFFAHRAKPVSHGLLFVSFAVTSCPLSTTSAHPVPIISPGGASFGALVYAEPHEWALLKSHVEKWFAQPDLIALQVILATAASHHFTDCPPSWIFVIGPSSCGKTSIFLQSVSRVRCAHYMDTLGRKGLLSGWQNKKCGFLSRYTNPLMLFADFTTMLSHDPREQAEVLGQLRRVHDGSLSINIGNGEVCWNGRATIIAASTPNGIDNAWLAARSMGDRFTAIRLTDPPAAMVREKTRQHRGHEAEIADGVANYGAELVSGALNNAWQAEETDLDSEELGRLAELCAFARIAVHRNNFHRDQVMSVDERESTGRLIKQLRAICHAHARIFRLPRINVNIALRVALDSIPPSRRSILGFLRNQDEATYAEVTEGTRLPRSTAWLRLQDLVEIGAVHQYDDDHIKLYSLTHEMRQLMSRSAEGYK